MPTCMHKNHSSKSVLQIVIMAVALAISAVSATAAVDSSGGPMPYARLAAQWWQWALETPNSMSPVLDQTGEFCGVNQKGEVWFLAGTFGGNAERTCIVPVGKSLFFPVVNLAYFAFLDDPPQTKSIPYIRKYIADNFNPDLSQLSATLDGIEITPIVFEKSVPFVVHLPDDNVFSATPDDIKNLMLAPCADGGYYVLLAPLDLGEHEIIFENEYFKVTYHLTVHESDQ